MSEPRREGWILHIGAWALISMGAQAGCDPSTCTAECSEGEVFQCYSTTKEVCHIGDNGCNAVEDYVVRCDNDDCAQDPDCDQYVAR